MILTDKYNNLSRVFTDKINLIQRKIEEYEYAIKNLNEALEVFQKEYHSDLKKYEEESRLTDAYITIAETTGVKAIIPELGLTEEFYEINFKNRGSL